MKNFPLSSREIPQTGDDTPVASVFRYVLRMSGWHQLGLCLLAVAVASLSMAPLELQRRLINGAIGESNVRLLLVLAAAYLAVLLAQGLLKYALRLYQTWVSESAIRYNRAHLGRLYECRLATEGDATSGEAMSIIGPEIDKLGGFVGEGLSQPVTNGGMLCAILGYMVVVEPFIALLSLPFLAPQLILAPLLQRRLNRLVEARVGLMRDLSDQVSETSGAGILQGDEHRLLLDGLYNNRMWIAVLKFGIKAAINLLNALAPLAALVGGGYLVIQGETTIGVVVAFVSGFDRLAAPLRELLAYYRVAAQARVQHDMIARWM